MYAAIDVGSNTLRMLVARCAKNGLHAELYRQKITRLGGSYSAEKGLSRESIERTLFAFTEFADILREMQIERVRVVGTAALRHAKNAQHLVNLVKLKTRLDLEVIGGKEEARLSSAGVLSVLNPCPETMLIFDIGGGSTELSLFDQKQMIFSQSYPLGVVQLCEEMPEPEHRVAFIKDMVVKLSADLLHAGISPRLLKECELVGTAGTVTTLAALNLEMAEYDRRLINNHQLDLAWMIPTLRQLHCMTIAEREQLPGLEVGRGDLIIPGLELLISLCSYFKKPSIRVADAGLLEGVLLTFCRHSSD